MTAQKAIANEAKKFALLAKDEIGTWKLLEGLQLKHAEWGVGKVQWVERDRVGVILLRLAFDSKKETFEAKALFNSRQIIEFPVDALPDEIRLHIRPVRAASARAAKQSSPALQD